MEQVKIPHGAYVVVGDGRKALFLRNEGDEAYPNLTTVQTMENPDQRTTHEAGTDRPGRGQESATTRRSAMEQTDFHAQAELRFARDVATSIAEDHEKRRADKFVLVAPARTLAELRKAIPERMRGAVIAEVTKDYTNRPVAEIERLLQGLH